MREPRPETGRRGNTYPYVLAGRHAAALRPHGPIAERPAYARGRERSRNLA